MCAWGGSTMQLTSITGSSISRPEKGFLLGWQVFFLEQQRIFVSCKTVLPAQDVVLPGAEQQGVKSDTFTGVQSSSVD